MASNSYHEQIEALRRRQRQAYRDLVWSLYKSKEPPVNLPNIGTVRKSISHDDSWSRTPKAKAKDAKGHAASSGRAETFTIYIGAQLKSMHNVRIVSYEQSLAELCHCPDGESQWRLNT